MAGPVRIAILADGSRARREFSQTGRSGARLGDVLKRAGRAAAIGLGVGLTAAAVGAGKLAQAAASDEQSAALLERTLKNTTGATDRQVAANERWITSQGKLLGVTDDELRPALARLVTATGDISKAQKLASLAMDVSAGTGKSLESVSTALMKAQNGQVSALSRLGIKTKNAAGETLSFKDATAEMADTFGGAASTKAKTLQGRVDRLKVMFTEAGEALGAKLLPPLSDLAFKAADGYESLEKFAQNKIAPKLEELAGWFRENKDELKDFAVEAKDTALPVIKTLASLVVGAVRGFSSLPGPVKEGVGQVLLAAIAFKGLSLAIAAVKTSALVTSLAGLNTNLRNSETRANALRGALRNAAGIGGVLALTASAKTSNSTLSTLTRTAGGAAIGFSVAGPLGAAIGGTAGLLSGMYSAGKAARDGVSALARQMQLARGDAVDLAGSLDQVTGAATRLTRQQILQAAQQAGIVTLTNRLGVNVRDVVGAITGQEGATRRLNQAYRENKGLLTGKEQVDLNTFLRRNSVEFAKSSREVRENNRALTPWKESLKGLPRDVRVRVKQLGAGVSRREIRDLEREFGPLTKKQKRIIVNAVGTEKVVRQVKGVFRVLEAGRNAKPNLSKWEQLFVGSLNTTQRQAKPKMEGLLRLLTQGTKGARADLKGYQQSVTTGVSRARGIAASEAPSVGAALGSGVSRGFTPYASILANQAAAAVRAAIQAARNAAVIKSPSRKMHEVGDLMGQGLVNGLAARKTDAKAGGRDLVRSLLEGVTDGTSGVDKALGKISALIEKRIKGKDEAKRERAALKALKGQYEQLRKNGREQDKNTRRIEAATSKTKSLIQAARQYAATIKQGFVDYGNVVGLGVRDGSSSVSLSGLLSQLEARAAASERFAALIRQLRDNGANRTTIQQLLDAGAEGGLATAEAIASGGRSAITQINSLTSQIASTGSKLGESMRKAYKQAGIQAAQGLVDGLKKRQRELDKVAERIASSLVKAVKKALGIKSPSRVFRSIGDQTLKGLELGLDETYVRRLGASRGAALKKGFGTPALDAYASNASAGAAQPVTVQVRLSADQVSQMARGKEYVADIDVFFKNGGTTQTIVKKGTIS